MNTDANNIFRHGKISIRGARQHNLKNIDVDIPRHQLVVITGLSGSGKSSLAFDTIYAEGQRRYVESLSAYARQFLELMQKPDVDSIEGLSPAISIEQKTTSRNPRSTVGTVTEIYDYLRLLYARIGIPYSPATGLPIESQTVSQMVDMVKKMPEGQKFMLLAPIVRGRKGEYKKDLADLQKQGFQRVKVDDQLYEIDKVPTLNKKLKHTIEVVVDRLAIRAGMETRLADSFELALKLSDGLAYLENTETGQRTTFSARFACPVSGFTIDEIEPRLFSFNNPFGACPVCDGLGMKVAFDPNLIIPDTHLNLQQGVVAPWAGSSSVYYQQTLESIAKHYGVSAKTSWQELPEEVQNTILYGSKNVKLQLSYDDGTRQYQTNKSFEGIIPNMERRWRETDSTWMREEFAKYQSSSPCVACHGMRLKPEALAIKMNGLNISELCQKSIGEAVNWFIDLPKHLTSRQNEIANRILKEVNERLGFLKNVGLEYISLGRASGTLSGGESQRIRLASQIGSGLTGVLYVLDEPSIGLHQRDNARLLITLRRLRDLGNTVLVVEHDEDAIRQADYVIDMGPAAGKFGGQIIAAGTPEELLHHPKSMTGEYLSGRRSIPLPNVQRKVKGDQMLTIVGAAGNNLKNIDVQIPLGVMTCITGVSGGGKSTLIIETLYKALAKQLFGSREQPAEYKEIKGLELLDKVIDIDQSPIGRTPRSNPVTYTGAFTPIREWFASLPESNSRGYKAGRFSFNVKGGRCEACEGDGVTKIEMHFLPDVYVPCDQCKGRRYNRETLEITYKGKSIADVLEMSVDDGVDFFQAIPSIRDKLTTLQKVGLGYVHIGQAANTLSGGEAQRIKLSKELSRRATGKTLYILDEPTTGLHFEDVRKLLEVLQTLVDQGNSVLIIEHNLEVIKTADWIIDLGPEGGDKGGYVVAVGTPEQIAAVPGSYTGQFLAPLLKNFSKGEKKPADANKKAKKTKKNTGKEISKKGKFFVQETGIDNE